MSVIEINQDLSNKGASVGRGGLALYLVVWLAMCLLKIAIFEVYASLKWNPWQPKLKSGACITKKRKPNCQGLHYMLIISLIDEEML